MPLQELAKVAHFHLDLQDTSLQQPSIQKSKSFL